MATTTARVTFTKTKTFTYTVDIPNYSALSDADILVACNLPNASNSIGELLAGSVANNGAIASGPWSVVTNTDLEPYTIWNASTALALNARISPTTPTGKLYTASAGTTGATEPTWPTTLAATVVSGTVTFTCIAKF